MRSYKGLEIKNIYFNWLCDLVDIGPNYYNLLSRLNNTTFYSNILMDDNRAIDGIDLRYKFANEAGFDQRIIASTIDTEKCSVLEMMVALAIRCDLLVTDDNSEVSNIFFDMIKNLQLDKMTDGNFNKQYVDNRLRIFLDKKYSKNGSGGLFKLKNIGYNDATKMEIWTQAMWYLNDFIESHDEGAFW